MGGGEDEEIVVEERREIEGRRKLRGENGRGENERGAVVRKEERRWK